MEGPGRSWKGKHWGDVLGLGLDQGGMARGGPGLQAESCPSLRRSWDRRVRTREAGQVEESMASSSYSGRGNRKESLESGGLASPQDTAQSKGWVWWGTVRPRPSENLALTITVPQAPYVIQNPLICKIKFCFSKGPKPCMPDEMQNSFFLVSSGRLVPCRGIECPCFAGALDTAQSVPWIL